MPAYRLLLVAILVCALVMSVVAQNPSPQNTSAPGLIRVNGTLHDASTKRGPGVVGVVFALYANEDSSAALWTESQSISIDAAGHYSAVLGANSKDGVPAGLFSTGEVRWLGVSVDGREQPRMQLVSVPYALKANEAQTLNGLTADEIAARAAAMASSAGAAAGTKVSGTAPTRDSTIQSSSTITNTAPIATTATNFTDTTSNQVVLVTQNGTGGGLKATTVGASPAVYGVVTSTTGSASGVRGESASTGTSSAGVYGVSSATTGVTYGVVGVNNSTSGTGLNGTATATSGSTIGLRGQANSSSGTAIAGYSTATSGSTMGVKAQVASASGTGLYVDNIAGGKIASFRNNGSEKMSVDGSGNVTAAGLVKAGSFSGNGAGLNGVVTGVSGTNPVTANVVGGSATIGLTAACSTYDVLRWNGSNWVCDSNLSKRSYTIVIGCDTCGALADADSQAAVFVNNAAQFTISSITCYSDTASAPTFNLTHTGGTVPNILSSSLTCTNTTSGASSSSFNSGENVIPVGDKISFSMVTAGGAHRATIVIAGTVN